MIRRILYPLISVVFALMACSEEINSPLHQNLVTPESTVLATKTKMVPHKGKIFFYPTAVTPTDDPLVVHIAFAGEGKATQFGPFTEIGEYLLHSDEEGTPLFISDVIATRYTAGGDEVYLANVTGIISLTGNPEHPMILEGDYNYNGGTGRFKNLTGKLHWKALGNADGSALSHFKGKISAAGFGM